jgi:zinc protease
MKKFYQSFLGSVPKGHNENSPAFQRRDYVAAEPSPEGTNDVVWRGQFQPSLRDSARFRIQPGVKTPGYFQLFLWNKGAAFVAMTLLIGSICLHASGQSNVYKANVGVFPLSPSQSSNMVLVADASSALSGGIASRPEELKFPALNYEPPAPEQFRTQLKSGAIAYVVPDHELPLVNIVIYVHTGEYLDPEGKEGLADFTGYLLARGGAGTNSADQLEERLAFLAASLSSDVSDTQGSVSMNLLSKDLDEGLGILRDVLFAPRFQDDKIALRKQQILQAMEQRNDDTAAIEGREAGFLAYGAQFWQNRYSTKASIDSITRNDIETFHTKYFTPGNFVVAVSGDFDRDQMVAKLEKLFSGQAQHGIGQPKIPTNVVFAPAGAYLVNKPDVNQGRVAMMLPGITRDNPDYFPIIVMNDILGGGGFTSRIMNRVRTEEGLAYDAHTSFPGGAYYPLTFQVGYQSKSRTVSYAASLAVEEINKMKSAPVSDLELKTSKGGFIDRFPRLFSTKAQMAGIFAQEEFTGRYAKDPEFYKKYRSRIGAVTAEDVQRVAKKYLDLDKMVVLAVGNKEDILLGYPNHPVKFQELAGGHFTELPLRDPMTMKPLPLAEAKKP